MKYAAGIDIGGTNTRVAIVDEHYRIIRKEVFATFVEDLYQNNEEIRRILSSFPEEITGVGVSCPGPLDLQNGVVLTPPNLKAWHYFPLSKSLGQLLQLPVILENDANLACLAESVIGAGKDSSIVQFLTISTGIGSGLCINNNIYRGAHGFAHEIANMILWNNGPQCGTLKKGSIESIASGTAITTRAKAAGLQVDHAGEVNDLAIAGNSLAREIMDDAFEYLANGIAAIFAVTDPDVIVLSGSVALKIEGFIEHLEQLVKTKVYDDLAQYVCLRRAELGEDCGFIGAAYLAFHQK